MTVWEKNPRDSVKGLQKEEIQASAAGNGLTNTMENHTFVPRARYLRLLRCRRRYELLYHSVLRPCSEFRDSRSFLWLNIKKSIHGESSRIKKYREIRHVPHYLVYIPEYPDFGRQEVREQAHRSMRRRCKHIFRVCLRQCAKGSLQMENLSATNRYLHLPKK